jgi:hypothetical protein
LKYKLNLSVHRRPSTTCEALVVSYLFHENKKGTQPESEPVARTAEQPQLFSGLAPPEGSSAMPTKSSGTKKSASSSSSKSKTSASKSKSGSAKKK